MKLGPKGYNEMFKEYNKKLVCIEAEAKKQFQSFIKIHDELEKKRLSLEKIVVIYNKKRKQFQLELWEKIGLCWCKNCHEFYPKERTELVYMEWEELDGENRLSHRVVRSLCHNCAGKALSSPRGGEDKFQCFKSKRSKDGFVIFVSGEWGKILNMKDLIIDTEPENCEKFYAVGKNIHVETSISGGLCLTSG